MLPATDHILKNKSMSLALIIGASLVTGATVGYSAGRYGNITIPYFSADSKLVNNALREPSHLNTQVVIDRIRKDPTDYYHIIKRLDHFSRPAVPLIVGNENYVVVLGSKTNHLVHAADYNALKTACWEKMAADFKCDSLTRHASIDFRDVQKIAANLKWKPWATKSWQQSFVKKLQQQYNKELPITEDCKDYYRIAREQRKNIDK